MASQISDDAYAMLGRFFASCDEQEVACYDILGSQDNPDSLAQLFGLNDCQVKSFLLKTVFLKQITIRKQSPNNKKDILVNRDFITTYCYCNNHVSFEVVQKPGSKVCQC